MQKVKTLEEVRKYLDKEYWENGTKSGYKGGPAVDWWWNNRWAQCFNQAIPIYDKKILDLGCGTGGFVASLVTFGADAYGIDLSDYAVEKAKKENSFLKNRIFQGSAHDLSRWPNEYFDILYSNQVFEHVPEELINNLIKETYRVLKKEGVCWFAIHMPDVRDSAEDKEIDQTHITLYPRSWWIEKFKAIGFKEDQNIDLLLRSTRTGYDHYSFFEDYHWETLVFRKI